MNQRIRWVPAKPAFLGQNQFLTPSMPPAEPKQPSEDGTKLLDGLMYGGLAIAGATLLWAVVTSERA